MNFLEDERVTKIGIGIVIILQIMTICLIVICTEPCKSDEEEKESEVALVIDDEEDNTDERIDEIKTIRVDIKGAVKKAGVYEISDDKRITDVIKIAGGLKSNASTKYLNLSKKLTDEMVIYVYTTTEVKNMNIRSEIKEDCSTKGEYIIDCAGSTIVENNNKEDSLSSGNNDEPSTSKVSLNNASKEELMSLNGIGEAKAEDIIDYRTKNNGFKSIDELKNVSGIGESLYNKVKDYITV